MLFTIHDGSQKTIQVGDKIVPLDGVLSAPSGALLTVVGASSPGEIQVQLPQAQGAPVTINLTTDAVIQVWRLQ